jgi:D-alanine-D-alanine ligase
VFIQVLMGGTSTEREVSLASGAAVVAGLERAGHKVAAYDFNPGQGRDVRHLLASRDLKQADVVFITLHGGEGEDGRIQAVLELAGKPYTGPGVRASALCMDKALTKILFEHNGVATPAWAYLVGDIARAWRECPAARDLGLPVVIKPVDQGSTVGLTIAESAGDVDRGIDLALKYSSGLVFEKYIPGRELTVAVVEKEVFPIVEIKPRQGFYDYERKYTKGLTDYECPAALDPGLAGAIQADALKAYLACGCDGFSRVDARLGPDGVAYFLEINTVPGMTDTSLVPMAAGARGVSFEALVDRIAGHGLRRGKADSRTGG